MEISSPLVLLFAFASLAASIVLNKIFLRFSSNLGTRSTGEVRFASTSKPSVGGFSFYIVFLLCFISIILMDPRLIIASTKETAGLFAAVSLGFLLGFADDAYNTNPVLKFSGQIACGIILVFTDHFIPLLPPGVQGGFTVNAIFTVIWVVGIMNSLNMLDNMDAITTSTSVCILGCALYMLAADGYSNVFTTLLIIGVMATLAGFLLFNWHPAKMYMGDTGSQFLGVFLAAVAIKLFWNFKDPAGSGFQIRQFVIPLLAFIMPIIDTTTVFIRRLARGSLPSSAEPTTPPTTWPTLAFPYLSWPICSSSSACSPSGASTSSAPSPNGTTSTATWPSATSSPFFWPFSSCTTWAGRRSRGR